MRRRLLGSLLLLGWLVALVPGAERPANFGPTDWPWWRGPERNGVAAPNQKPPLKWSETENVLWQTAIPGRGHGAAIVVGDQVFLATADEKAHTQSVLCLDRRTGKQLWMTEVHRGNFEKGNAKATQASSTVACDGERVFVNFLHDRAIHTTALDRQGKQLWQTKVTNYKLHQGFGSSPAVYGPLVLVSADNKGGSGCIAGLDRATGKVVWKYARPAKPNYASPIILKVAGREQLFLTGCDQVTSLDPRSGKKLWEIDGATTETVTSTPTDGQHIFTSGGYPRSHVAAIRADGSGKIVWDKAVRVYVPSMLVKDGYLYGVQDSGTAFCWKADTGKEVWSGRLDGTFSASPVLVGERIFATSESGRTYVFGTSPEKFALLGENHLGSEVLATPTYCGDRIYFRVARTTSTGRQEVVYCIGAKE